MNRQATLVADVGGTNTRLSFADQNGLAVARTVRYPNATLSGFEDAIQRYLSDQKLAPPDAMCIAIAGPVGDGRGVLTNRSEWTFDTAALSETLAIKQVHLINDLAALGYALPDLPPRVIRQIGGGTAQSDQALVVGIATGFNVSLSLNGQVFEAELGHASLPSSVMDLLQKRLGYKADAFETVEMLFCGRGLELLHKQLGAPPTEASEITAQGGETLHLFGQALGVLCREMTYQYMPLGGLYFNGSLARAVLQGEGAKQISNATAQDAAFSGRFGQVPLFVITEDTAALYGCARYAALNTG